LSHTSGAIRIGFKMDSMDLRKQRLEALIILKAELEEQIKNCKNDFVRIQLANQYENVCEKIKGFHE